ncbi:hypothetical protein H8E52_05320 [bacterium]|nr:hypothetical protein [bacterium]
MPTTSSKWIWSSAFLLALMLHLGIFLAIEALPEAEARVAVAAPPPIEFVFAPEPEAKTPRQFTELPDDRADTPPDLAEFLSNVDSRARNPESGREDQTLPQLDGRTEIPQLDMAPPAEEPAKTQVDKSEARRGELLEAYRDFKQEDPMSPSPQAQDYKQEALSNADGSVSLVGDVSMNTAAWVFGEWMKSFRRKVMRVWDAPYAFNLGMIEGWTFVELEVGRNGRLIRCDVLDETGHESLRISSVNAIQTAGPYDHFPDRVPEETLTLRIKMIYSHYQNNPNPSRRGAP